MDLHCGLENTEETGRELDKLLLTFGCETITQEQKVSVLSKFALIRSNAKQVKLVADKLGDLLDDVTYASVDEIASAYWSGN